MNKDLLNEPFDADVAAAVERLRQSWLRDKQRRAEERRVAQRQQAQSETIPLKGFEDMFVQVMDQTLA